MKIAPHLLLIALPFLCAAQPATTTTTAPSFSRQQDVVYSRSYGTALTLDVFTPNTKPNGAGVVFVVSGGWISSHDLIGTPFFGAFIEPLTRRGYTVFAVCHGCQPKFQIPEIVEMLNRSVRFVRYHAKDYDVDPQRLGITGGSAGGHLSLMQGLAPKAPKADAPDPVDRVSAQVQAVGCFFPPTDFLNYGEANHNAIDDVLKPFMGAFDFHELDAKTHKLEPITDRKRIEALEKEISPAYFVSKDDPPTLIIHGDADKLVPIQQAHLVIDKLKELNVPAELVVKPGAGHGWGDIKPDMEKIADWFDKYLAKGDR